MTLLRLKLRRAEEVVSELVEIDEAVNYDILDGHKGETISSRCGRAIKRVANCNAGKWDFLLLVLAGFVNGMPWFGPNHCVSHIQQQYITELD